MFVVLLVLIRLLRLTSFFSTVRILLFIVHRRFCRLMFAVVSPAVFCDMLVSAASRGCCLHSIKPQQLLFATTCVCGCVQVRCCSLRGLWFKTTSVVAASSRGVALTTCRYGDRGCGRLVGLLLRVVCFSVQRILLLKLYTVSPCLLVSFWAR